MFADSIFKGAQPNSLSSHAQSFTTFSLCFIQTAFLNKSHGAYCIFLKQDSLWGFVLLCTELFPTVSWIWTACCAFSGPLKSAISFTKLTCPPNGKQALFITTIHFPYHFLLRSSYHCDSGPYSNYNRTHGLRWATNHIILSEGTEKSILDMANLKPENPTPLVLIHLINFL